MEHKIKLTTVEVEESVFFKIFERFPSFEQNRDIFSKITNEIPKNKIYYNGTDCFLCRLTFLNGTLRSCNLPTIKNIEGWKTIRVVKKNAEALITSDSFEISIDGGYAFNLLRKLILNHYTKEEFEKCLNSHIAEYNQANAQFHYIYGGKIDNIYTFENTYKYDINSAHAAALIEIFPKAKDVIVKLYEERKIHPENKKILNYFVGYLCKVNHRKTYNWVVQRTTKILTDAIKLVGGKLLYANTDGFLVQNPKNLINASKTIGEFKLEYEGTSYFIQTRRYWAYQCGNDITGNCPVSARNRMDLSVGNYITYDKTFIKTGVNPSGLPTGYYKIENIEVRNNAK